MDILKVKNLCKNYPSFNLNNVSLSLTKGKITGFIGRNGAGKTTTLKSLFNFIYPDSGSIMFFDKEFSENEIEIKQKTGFVSGGVNYYSNKKIKTITKITKSFYNNWDDKQYYKYLNLFKIDENKTPKQLSEGMKVKYSLALALSHNAELLILDEPTSGLDPVSRDEILDIFMDLCDKGTTILFSTHITSDLEKCADNIIYIKNGQIIAESELKSFIDSYKTVELNEDELTEDVKNLLVGLKRSKTGHSALIRKKDLASVTFKSNPANLEDIMVHFEKE